jgi:hypothetical protein
VDAKEDHLEQRVWVGVLQEILGYIRVFKKLRYVEISFAFCKLFALALWR